MLSQQFDLLTVALLMALLMLLLAALVPWLLSVTRPKPKAVREEVVELVGCPVCGHEISRKYEKGDYVGKVVGTCPRGDGALVVKAIYVEKYESPK